MSRLKGFFRITEIALFCCAILLAALISGKRNFWSVQFMKWHHSGSGNWSEILPFPENHLNAAIWMAALALDAGNPGQAKVWLSETEVQNNLYHRVTGDLLMQEGNYSQAIAEWLLINDYYRLLDLAYDLISLGDWQTAHTAYSAAFQARPEESIQIIASYMINTINTPGSAEALLLTALEQYPQSKYRLTWMRQLASSLKVQEKWENTRKVYEQIMTEFSDDIQVYIDTGWLYYDAYQDVGAAQNIFVQVMEKYPDQGDGYFAQAQLLYKSALYQEAGYYYQTAIKLNPDNFWWRLAYANMLRDHGNMAQAINEYNQIIKSNDSFANGYFELSWAYYLQGDYLLAEQMISQAFNRAQTLNKWWYYRAGQIYQASGKLDLAKAYYELALQIDPNLKAAIDDALGDSSK